PFPRRSAWPSASPRVTCASRSAWRGSRTCGGTSPAPWTGTDRGPTVAAHLPPFVGRDLRGRDPRGGGARAPELPARAVGPRRAALDLGLPRGHREPVGRHGAADLPALADHRRRRPG